MGKPKLITHELKMTFHQITEKAILLSDDGVKKNAVWLPLSQIEVSGLSVVGGVVDVTAPEWLLKKNGLI